MSIQRITRFTVLVALTMLILLLSVSFAGAQQTTPAPATEVEFVGLVEAMTLDTLTVNQQVIDVSNAEFTVAVSLGIPVKIEGTLLADGSIVAREVTSPEAVGSILPGEFEIVGLLTSIDGSSYVIGQLVVDARGAEIKAGVSVGALVKAHVSQSADGSLSAREIELAAGTADDNANANANDNAAGTNDNNANANDNSMIISGDEVEIVGTLTGMTADTVIVGGQTISIANAEIKEALILGALVKVHLSSVDGQLIAREIELARAQDQVREGDDNGNDNDNQNDNSAAVLPGCTPAQPAGWVTYTVRPGDTLSGIAAATGASLGDLAQVNCIANPAQIRVGQQLFVPRAPSGSTGVGNTNSNGNSNDNLDDDNGNSNLNSNDNVDDHGGNDNGADDNGGNDNSDDHGGNSGSSGGNDNSDDD
ncbi:MAG: LysM peptidoglycan-binding domain-containing protein [Anaerolineae bacterium]|nr:LysM peptidoglycan-binding domain-containing protein [Anaerolineae bacterium]